MVKFQDKGNKKIGFLLSLMLFFSTTAFADNIPWQVIDEGGSLRSSGNYELLDASGQGVIGEGNSPSYNLLVGYILPEDTPTWLVNVYDSLGNFVCGTDTIQKGVNACPVGGTVSVAAGTYTEAVYINKRIALVGNGTPTITVAGLGDGNTVTFDGSGADNARISGFRITGASGNWPNGMGILCKDDADPTITNNAISENHWNIECNFSSPTITNNTISGSGNSYYGIDCRNSSSSTITNNTILRNTIGISCFSSSFPTITNNTISGNGYGIHCESSSSPHIINNIIIGNNTDGIYCNNTSPFIINNTILENGRVGIYCYYYYSSPTIYNNIITENGTTSNYYGIYNDPNYPGNPVINYNCVRGNGQGGNNNYYNCSAGPNDISADPQFIGNGDFHLGTTSPCINTGTNSAVPSWCTTDKDGNPRIVNGIVDMGAYEYQGNPIHDSKTTIIVATLYDNTVLKLDSNGDILWATNVGSNVYQAVENPTDKTIYAIGGGNFTKLSKDGVILLQKSISGNTIDVDPSDGSFYVDDYGEPAPTNKYDANGNFIKSFGSDINATTPAVYRADGSVYVNSYTAGVYKFDKNGNLLWQRAPVAWHNSYGRATIVVDQRDGSVVATAHDEGYADNEGVVVRLDADGNTMWAKTIQYLSYSRNAIDPTENVVYGAVRWTNGVDLGDELYKINLINGDVIWSKDIEGKSPVTPSVDSFDGSIYVGDIDTKTMFKIDKNGNILLGPKYIGYQMFYLETTSDVVGTKSGYISGKITESDGKTFISEALVEALQDTVVIGSGTTDANGSYSISLAQGTYTVRASKQQYLPTQTTGVMVSQGTTTSVDLILYSARIKPTLLSPQSAGSEVLLKVQVGDEQEPVDGLFTLFGTLTYSPSEGIEILKVSPGEFMGSDLQVFVINKSDGKIQFMMRRKTGTGGVTGYGSVLDIKFKISETALLGTVTFSLSDIQAYGTNSRWISLLPESTQMKINRVEIKPVVSPPILPGAEFEVNIQVGDVNNEVNGLKSVSFDLQWGGADIVEVVTPISENVKPGEFLGTSTLSLATLNNGTLSICVGRTAGESDGYGTVAKVKFRVLPGVKPGTKGTFTISNVVAYNPDAYQIKLIPVICPFTIEISGTWTQVWPGDTDNNGLVDEWDIMPIAFYLGKTGQQRETPSINWQAWSAPYWNIWEPPCPDAVYSDANGDGKVDIEDVHALIINYSKTHPKTKALSSPRTTDDSLFEKYQEILKNRPDLLEKVKCVLEILKASPEMQQGAQEFIMVLQDLVESLPAAEFKVYPNPYRPTSIHSALGGIKFDNLGTNWNIKIYNIAGELVHKAEGTGNDYTWRTAKDVASGVYIYIVNSTTLSKKIGKLAIIK